MFNKNCCLVLRAANNTKVSDIKRMTGLTYVSILQASKKLYDIGAVDIDKCASYTKIMKTRRGMELENFLLKFFSDEINQLCL